MENKTKRDTKLEEDFLQRTGLSIEQVRTLYQRAVENDWRTVQTMTHQAISKFAASRATAQEAAELLKLTRAMLDNENGAHTKLSGLADPAP